MEKNFFDKKMRRGFTLLEVMVTIAVIGIMVSVTFVSLSGQKKREETRVVAEELVAHINEIRQQALTGDAVDGNNNNRACGFGIQFYEGSKYRIYYRRTGQCSATNFGDASTTPVLFDWTDGKVSFTFTPTGSDYIFFRVPFANSFGNIEKIQLQHKSDSSYTYCVILNTAGSASAVQGNC